MKSKVECQECGAEINVPGDAVVGEILTCPDCGGEYEITSIVDGNLELKPAERVGEDWGQ
ncbi:MAG TPA: alpha-aminoadipate/glutamate carrier protein LysW/ArgW [Nitrososphaera sp.]|jgi:alpha-aminoadipate carrier protein LysW|nr:alpha-aminoadipate/glutamate carrier protein LysW/ArgW [Nitrososphaera sp.]